jgi:hypothetical protein
MAENIEALMPVGYAHIISLPRTEDSAGLSVPSYQFTFSAGGTSYGRMFGEEHLVEFLRNDLGLDLELIERTLKELRAQGNSTIANLDMPENETAALGFEQVPSDI